MYVEYAYNMYVCGIDSENKLQFVFAHGSEVHFNQ